MRNKYFVLERRSIEFIIFSLFLLFACVPYLGYGMTLINSGVEIIGSLNRNVVAVGGVGKYISFMKDILAIILILLMITRLPRKDAWPLGIFLGLIYYGGIVLFLNGRSTIMFTIAGIRTFIFLVVTVMFCKRYYAELHTSTCRLKIFRILFLTLLINTFFSLSQAISSGSLLRLGSGAYRFSGAFPGSGNLGCYSIAVMLFLFTIVEEKSIKIYYIIAAYVMCIFLTVASGTRTCIILAVAIFIYSTIQICGNKMKLSWKLSLLFIVILGMLFGSSALALLTKYVGRGSLAISGSGRINIFMNTLNNSSVLQIFFGRGLGVGTNVSITMGLPDTSISDSTYNLIFTQFGFIGLLIFTTGLLYILIKLFYHSYKKKTQCICFIVCVAAMYTVGNLFEHIAMIIIFTCTYYMIYVDCDKLKD